MASFGENLRREREMRGVSLDEIAGSTKISVRFLQAVENDDFASLPGGIFTRSFIRAYAKYLGLDDEQVMSEFQLTAAQAKDVELSPLMFASSSNTPRPERRPLLLPVALAVAMLLGAYSLFRYAHRREESPVPISSSGPVQAAPSPATAPVAPAPPALESPVNSEPSAGLGSSAQRTQPATGATGSESFQAQNTSSPSQAAAAQPNAAARRHEAGALPETDMVLTVGATQRVWVSVDADGKTALQRTLTPEDSSTITAKDHFDLVTANAQALIVTLNGEILKMLGRQGEVKKVHLTRSDLKSASIP
jgi:cytoskeletal protein RodZ